ncbi:MAG: hypothetical protein ACKOHK_00925, partial [Planctomycetia bacterium]
REESHRSTPAAGGGGWTPTRRSLSLYREWFGPDGRVPADYIDTHCWAFTPESFELIVRDTIAFGLVPLRIASGSATCGLEVYVGLARPAAPVAVAEDASRLAEHPSRHAVRRRRRHRRPFARPGLALDRAAQEPLPRGATRRPPDPLGGSGRRGAVAEATATKACWRAG